MTNKERPWPLRLIPLGDLRWLPIPAQCACCEHPLFLELSHVSMAPTQIACPRCDWNIFDPHHRVSPDATESQRLETLNAAYKDILFPGDHCRLISESQAFLRMPQSPFPPPAA